MRDNDHKLQLLRDWKYLKMKKASPNFKKIVEHIDNTWKELKGYGYPFTGRDFRYLKDAERHFQAWGVMALWDSFLSHQEEDKYPRKCGYSLIGFFNCLPWLVDDKSWKARAKQYEEKMALPIQQELKPILENLLKG